jgi:beta-xylosidase
MRISALIALALPVLSHAANFTNPVLWEDYPDLDVFRIGDVFYYSSSSFAFSPGAPMLKSYDLVNWAPETHSIPRLNFGPAYDLPANGSRAFVKGVFASTVRYRKSDDTFYWYGCVEGKTTYIWGASGTQAGTNDGEVTAWNWTARGTIGTCFYDCGLLIDDDDTLYVAFGNTQIQVAQLSPDGLSIVKQQQVYSPPNNTYIEGSRMYKYNGSYYIFNDKVASGEWVIKAPTPFGPYTQRVVFDSLAGPIANAGFAHQGGIVDTADGRYFYTAFMDSYPGGRIPVVAPLSWTDDGWPVLETVNGTWGVSYPYPVNTTKTVASVVGTDTFTGTKLSDEWEWNHNPDNSKWRLQSSCAPKGGLVLQTASITTDLFQARNTLTHRVIGPKSTGTFAIDISRMADGDRAGAALFRDQMAYIGVWKNGSTPQLVMVNNLILNGTTGWTTQSNGTVAALGPALPSNTRGIWLRVVADITPAFTGTTAQRYATFQYSLNGIAWTTLGPALTLFESYTFFTGYRYGVFNFATEGFGGQITVKNFTMEKTS